MPAALATWETFARAQCREFGERFVPKRFERFTGQAQEFTSTGNGFLPAELNGDDSPDYIMFTPNHGCQEDERSRDYGSRGGPPTDFVISTPTGYRVVDGFGGWVDASMVQRRGGRDVLIVSYGHNGDCGVVRDAVWGWNGNTVEIIERRNEQGALVDQEGCPVIARQSSTSFNSSGGWVAASFPPLPRGTYAWSMPCDEAARDDPFPPLMRLTARSWSEMDGESRITGIENNGPSRYRFRTEVEDEAGRKSTAYNEIRIIDGTSFESNGRVMRHCPVDYYTRLQEE